MKDFWVLGRFFSPNHDRAIRYLGTSDAMKTIKKDIPKESNVEPTWCDRCNCFHITREGASL